MIVFKSLAAIFLNSARKAIPIGLLSFTAFALCGCTGTSGPVSIQTDSAGNTSSSPLDGTYYCERVMLYDEGGNLQHFYKSSDLGSENTSLTITNGTNVEYTWYYHGEADNPLVGSIRNIEVKEDMSSGDVLFEGVGDKYAISYKNPDESGNIGSLSLVYPFGENGNQLGLLFKTEKQNSSTTAFQDLEDVESKLSDFKSSDTYSKIEAVINNYYSAMDHELIFDEEKKELILDVNIDGVVKSLGKSDELDSTWAKLCDGFDSNSTSIQTVINTGGYRGIHFVLRTSDGSTEVYRSENGERVYLYKPAGSAVSSVPSSGSTGTSSAGSSTSSSFEKSAVYKEISQIMKESFPDNNPKVSYKDKDKMLTVTLTGGKNWKEAVLNDKASYANWISFTNSLLKVSSSGYDKLCNAGYSDVAFTIMVVSYEDTSKALYACMNGVPYYDFTVN